MNEQKKSNDSSSSGALIRHRFLSEQGPLGFRWVGGVLLFVVASGLAIWLLPFSVSAQISVLLHTALGLVLVIPLTLWQFSHWLGARLAPRSFRKICAYSGFWVLLLASASGLVLTGQALFGLHISTLFHRVHLWSSILTLPALAYHVWPRAKKLTITAANGLAILAAPSPSEQRRRMWGQAGATSAALLLLGGVAAIAYRAPDYSKYKLSSSYQWFYGPNPFAPSLATTVDGRPVAPEILAGSKSCGASGCHTAIYREWQASAHRWSAEDTFFQAVQAAMIHEEGAPVTRYCGGCHDPVSLLAGYKDASTGISAPGFRQGDSCVICHSMRRVDVQGNGNYVFGAPKLYLYEYSGGRIATTASHFLIRAYPWQHNRDYDITLAQRPESCAACHKQFIDKYINHLGWVQLQNQYDDWKHGKWNADPDPAKRLRCQQCHMYYEAAGTAEEADPYDQKEGLGPRHRNHYFAAGNQTMPEILGAPDASGQIGRVEQWLHGKRSVPEIAKIWPDGPIVPIRIVAPASARPGEEIDLRAVISNNKVGHSFPTGPLDLIRAWIELVVRDGTGREIFHTGKLDAANHIEPGSFILKAVGVNPQGEEIVRHDLWHLVGAKFKRAVFPGYSDMSEFRFRIPRDARGPLELTARLRYRKANQYFMDMVYPGQNRTARITDISSDRIEIAIAGAAAQSSQPAAFAPAPRGAPNRQGKQ